MADWAGNDPDRLFGALVSARSRKAYVQRLSDDQLRRLYGRLYAGPGSPGFTTRETSRELQRRGLTP
jgi:hypothetical protein